MEYIVLFINMQKYMKDYDKNKESSYLKDWDINNLHGWAQSQKLPERMKIEKVEKLVASLNIKQSMLYT